jgi:hypothetical protein
MLFAPKHRPFVLCKGLIVSIKLAAILMAVLFSASVSSAQEQLPKAPAKSSTTSLSQPSASELAMNATPPAGGSDDRSAYVRPVRMPSAVTDPEAISKPFRSIAVGIKANTLGAGVEIATPLSLRFNLRSSYSMLAFDDSFNIDGINYNARLHLKSSETTVDWFPLPAVHVSTGILWFKNSMTAPVDVGPGQTFTLGGQKFLNSIDDPIVGNSSVVYPHSFAPVFLIGLGNIIPRSGRHLSFPFEIGAAYTGSPQINLNLTGTICTTDGCVNLSQNTEAQGSLKQEIQKLNNDLSSYPLFPIVSMGVAYHF